MYSRFVPLIESAVVGGAVNAWSVLLQVFVANPKKPPQVEAILRRNKDKLLSFLKNFHNDKEDEQFSVRFILTSSYRFVRLLKLLYIRYLG
jgi:hypothetical protein